jgi:hypothetical protein
VFGFALDSNQPPSGGRRSAKPQRRLSRSLHGASIADREEAHDLGAGQHPPDRQFTLLTALVAGGLLVSSCGSSRAADSAAHGPRAASMRPVSKQYVAPSCQAPANRRACSVALRYLAALDLDRAEVACGLLDGPTLAAAGGMAGCTRTLLQARGIRIRYSILAALASPLGTTIRFTTAGGSDPPLHQQMLVSRAGRIIAVVPELWR